MIKWVHTYSQALTKTFNDCVINENFPDFVKYADITPIFKEGDTTEKSNYRPLSIFSNFKKIFEKLIYTHINSFMEPKLSNYLAGFCRTKTIKLEEW